MPKILFLTPQLPFPPQQGASLRNLNILHGLVKNHEVSLLTYGETLDKQGLRKKLHGCKIVGTVPIPERMTTTRIIQLIGDRQPDLSLRLVSEEFMAELRKELSNVSEDRPYEIVQIEGLELAYTIPQIRSLSPSSKIILDCHNAEYGLQQRARKVDAKNPRRWPAYLYSSIQVRRLKSFEAWACRAVDWVVAVSDEDKQQLLELMPEINITVIPNCINVSEYAMDRQETAYQYDLLFTGKMDYRPNIDAVLWFAESIWPKVLKERPQTTWAIVGQNPHPRLHKLASSEGIKIIGWVERIQAYLSGATVFIMPFRVGSGTRLKLIEAMASGIPVVSTRLGVEGFRVKDDRELMIADQPEDFSKAILTLLEDSKKRVRLVTAATTFANQYDYRRVIPKFDKLYKQLLQSKVNTQ